MDNILLLDTSITTFNKGDDIIMECTRKELAPLLENAFEITLPTHVSPFQWYQVWRNSLYVQRIASCDYKFVGGSNILIPNLLTHFPQWNINLFNYQPMKGCILVGVGAGAGAEGKMSKYTRMVYQRLLNHDFFHSARDERSKQYIERLGLKAINTGCVTMWMLTPEFCATIPTTKADRVVFTLTASTNPQRKAKHQQMIDILLRNYHEVWFWPQGIDDLDHFRHLNDTESIRILAANKQAYDDFLTQNDTDYVGTRLHGGVYAMRHGRRAIIIAIDERARSINEKNHLNCIDFDHLDDLEEMITSEFKTKIVMDFDSIRQWKSQFEGYKFDI